METLGEAPVTFRDYENAVYVNSRSLLDIEVFQWTPFKWVLYETEMS